MNTNGGNGLVVLCTCPDNDVAGTLARALVGNGLAACVNVIDGVRSVYRWRGEVTEDAEVLLLIKTSPERYESLERAIIDAHPYELPEVIAVPIERGYEHYLRWINEQSGS